MVFGIPITPIGISRRRSAAAMPMAPRIDPSPPITNKMSIWSASSWSTIRSGSCAPRDEPRMVPPWALMSCTSAGVSANGSYPQPGTRPANPLR